MPLSIRGDYGHIERGPHLENIFTIRRDNKKYLTGESGRISSRTVYYLVTAAMLGFILLVVLSEKVPFTRTNRPLPSWIIPMLAAATIALSIAAAYSFTEARRFTRNGKLLIGNITAVSTRLVWNYKSNFPRQKQQIIIGY